MTFLSKYPGDAGQFYDYYYNKALPYDDRHSSHTDHRGIRLKSKYLDEQFYLRCKKSNVAMSGDELSKEDHIQIKKRQFCEMVIHCCNFQDMCNTGAEIREAEKQDSSY